MGLSNGPNGSVGIEDWKTVGIGDGMYNSPDPEGRYEYNDQEFGHPVRVDLEQRTRTLIAPTAVPGRSPLRINWTAPLRLSPHDSKTVYFGAEVLFRSRDRGNHWEVISPDLTTNDPNKISGPRAAIQHCTIVTMAESPLKADVLWVGTDDGKIQLTQDGGGHWTDLTASVAAAGGSENAWVTRVYPSKFDAGTAYVTKSRRRQDDFRPYVLRTTDFGKSWTMLTNGLSPRAAANVIIEDNANPDVLFLGTDVGLFVSFDKAKHWEPFKANVPPAPVHDLLVHPRENDLIVGTFGRGIWVANVSPLRDLEKAVHSETGYLFPVQPFSQRREVAWGNYALYGDRYPVTRNEPNGMAIYFCAPKPQGDEAKIEIADSTGKSVRHPSVPSKPGLNRVVWLLDDDASAPVPPGDYQVALNVGRKTMTQPARLLQRAPEDSPRPTRFPRENPEPDVP